MGITQAKDSRPPRDAQAVAGAVSAVLGAVTAAVALVVVPGGAAMLLRLHEADLPTEAGVVSSLPTEFLFAIGLGSVLVPLLILYALIAAVVVLPAKRTADSHPTLKEVDLGTIKGDITWVESSRLVPQAGESKEKQTFSAKVSPQLTSERGQFVVGPLFLSAISPAVLAFLVTLAIEEDSSVIWVIVSVGVVLWLITPMESGIGAALWWCANRLRRRPRPFADLKADYLAFVPSAALQISWTKRLANILLMVLILALLIGLPFLVEVDDEWWGFGVAALSVVIWLGLVRPIARSRAEKKAGSARALGRLAGLVIVAFLPWAVLFAGYRGELPQTTVCLGDGQRFDGSLVGETSERVYVGEAAIRVVSIIEDDALARLAQEAFRSADEPFDFNALAHGLTQVALSRVDLVVTDSPPSGSDLVRLTANAVAVLQLSPDADLAFTPVELRDAAESAIEEVEEGREALEREASDEQLPDVVREQPLQRIVEIPFGKIERIYVGGSGAC